MKPADDPSVDYRALVREGYDRCAADFSAARMREDAPELELLLPRLAKGSRVLDLGCGAGVPVAAALARRHRVVGVDFSAEQIRRARSNVPTAEFIEADLMSLALAAGSFDAAVAFYSIFHLPREEHEELLRRVHGWLAPGGHFLATVARDREDGYTEDGFFGVPMYWSNWGREDYVRMLEELGFELLATGTLGHGYSDSEARRPEAHPLLFARKRQ
ncbi:MAG: class I SAM-dependent methyltransferase [Myxococcota bacterium]